ncbi:MAG: hypothetical protein VX125_07515 [Pseudomonadota bacterium]|nr:hypothetical protein [Pseudomonadota bacterium]
MTNEKIYMELLNLIKVEQENGSSLYLDDLINKFTEDKIRYNIQYLINHGLVNRDSSDLDDRFGYAELTHKGYDFLSKNGGLTRAVNEKLNTIIIKIDEEQFRALLIERVNQSNLTDNEKQGVVSAIKNLPGEMVTTLATKLLETGLENLLDVLPSIGIG